MNKIQAYVIFLMLTAGRSAIGAMGPLAPSADAGADEASVLARSQVSYRAEGGFTGVESFGVIISCVEGEVSVLASIHDSRLPGGEPARRVTRISSERYLELWRTLIRHAAMKLGDGPQPGVDVADEFTVTFNISVGESRHQFKAHTLSLPASARYEALRHVIDGAVDMSSLWTDYGRQIAALTHPVTFESLQANLNTELD